MSLNGMGLGFVFTAVDHASNVMRGVGQSFQRLDTTSKVAAQRVQGSMGGLLAGMAAVKVGAGAMGASFDAAMSAGTFEQQLNQTRMIMNASVEEAQSLRARAVQAGMETQYSPHEALSGLKELGTLGFVAADATNALGGTLDFAAAAGLSVAEASATTGSALRVFSMEAGQAGEAADKLLKISTLTALQANDLQLALGSVSRGAGVTRQGLDDMLISMGLVKNTGVDASVAGQSVSSAMLAVAKNAKLFKQIGVDVTNADGSFKSFLDIALETDQAMAGMSSEPERVAKIYKLFTKFGLTAVNAIGSQLSAGMATSTGEIVKNEEALKYLRRTMGDAAGTAADFRDAMLDTLPGQLTLIQGLWQTFQMEMGVATAALLKPIATFIKEGLTRLIEGFRELSPPVQRVVGLIGLVGGALVAGAGGFLLLAATLSLALPMISSMAAGFVAALPAIIPVLAAVAALGAAFFALREAYNRNIGGFADTVGPLLDKVRLFFSGLFQYITDGFISGDTATKLQDPQHSGLLHFMVLLISWGHRAKVFILGVVDSFQAFLDRMRGPFEQLSEAIGKVQETIHLLISDVDTLTPGMDKVEGTASAVGTALGWAFNAVVTAVTIVASSIAGFVTQLREIKRMAEPFITPVSRAFEGIGEAIEGVKEDLGFMDEGVGASSDAWESFGAALAYVAATVLVPLTTAFGLFMSAVRVSVGFLRGAIHVVKGVVLAFGDVIDAVKLMVDGDWTAAWEKMRSAFDRIWNGVKDALQAVGDSIMGVIGDILDFLADVIMAIPEKFRPEFLEDMATSIRRVDYSTEQVDPGYAQIDADQDTASMWGAYGRDVQAYTAPANQTSGPKEGGANAAADAGHLASEIASALEKVMGRKKPEQQQQVVIKVDGQVLAEAVQRGNSALRGLSFGADAEVED